MMRVRNAIGLLSLGFLMVSNGAWAARSSCRELLQRTFLLESLSSLRIPGNPGHLKLGSLTPAESSALEADLSSFSLNQSVYFDGEFWSVPNGELYPQKKLGGEARGAAEALFTEWGLPLQSRLDQAFHPHADILLARMEVRHFKKMSRPLRSDWTSSGPGLSLFLPLNGVGLQYRNSPSSSDTPTLSAEEDELLLLAGHSWASHLKTGMVEHTYSERPAEGRLIVFDFILYPREFRTAEGSPDFRSLSPAQRIEVLDILMRPPSP